MQEQPSLTIVQETPPTTTVRVLVVNDVHSRARTYKEVAAQALRSLNIRPKVKSFYFENIAQEFFKTAIKENKPIRIVLMEYEREIHPPFMRLLREEALQCEKPVSFVCVIDGGRDNPLRPGRGDGDENLDFAVQWCIKPVTEEKLVEVFKVCLGI